MKTSNQQPNPPRFRTQDVLRRVAESGRRCGEFHHLLRRLGLPCSVFCFFLIALNATTAVAARREVDRSPNCNCSSKSVEQIFKAQSSQLVSASTQSKHAINPLEDFGGCHRHASQPSVAQRVLTSVQALTGGGCSTGGVKIARESLYAQQLRQRSRPTFTNSGREIAIHLAPKNSPPN